jgi:23S rRNA (cytosine1962-C5)-methyltransferase
VYSKEVEAHRGGLVPGDVVTVYNRAGTPLKRGVWDDQKVAVRIFVGPRDEIDGLFVERIVAKAKSRRVLPLETTAYRLVHGENDGLPGVRVDVWNSCASISLDSPSLDWLVPLVAEAVASVAGVSSVVRAYRPGEGKKDRAQLVTGEPVGERITVHELGLKKLIHESYKLLRFETFFTKRNWRSSPYYLGNWAPS